MKEVMVPMLALTLVLTVLGCGGSKVATTEEPQPTQAEPAAEPAAPAAAGEAELLAMADEADGTVDRVIGKCAVCGLAMDGSADHATYYKEYSFHLCSSHCKETFDHDPAAVVARLELPTEP